MTWLEKIRGKVNVKRSVKNEVIQQWSYTNSISSSNDGLTSSHQSDNDDVTENDQNNCGCKASQSRKDDVKVTVKPDIQSYKNGSTEKNGILEYLRRKSIATSLRTRKGRRDGKSSERIVTENAIASPNGGSMNKRRSSHLNDFMGYEIPYNSQSPSNTSIASTSSSSIISPPAPLSPISKLSLSSSILRKKQQRYMQEHCNEILFVPVDNLDDDDEEIWHQNVFQVATTVAAAASIEADQSSNLSISQSFFTKKKDNADTTANRNDNDDAQGLFERNNNNDNGDIDDQAVANKSVGTSASPVTRMVSNRNKNQQSMSSVKTKDKQDESIKKDEQLDNEASIPAYTDDVVDEDKPSHIFSMIFESAAAAKITRLSEHRPDLVNLDEYNDDDNEQVVVATCCQFFPFRRTEYQLSSTRFFFAANSTCGEYLQSDNQLASKDTTMDTVRDYDNSADSDGSGHDSLSDEMPSNEIRGNSRDRPLYNPYDSSDGYNHERSFSTDHDTRDLSFGRLSSIITSIIEEEEELQQLEEICSDDENCDNLDDSEPESSGGWSVSLDSNSLSSEVACLDLDDGFAPGTPSSLTSIFVESDVRTTESKEMKPPIDRGLLRRRRNLIAKSMLVQSTVQPTTTKVSSATARTEQSSSSSSSNARSTSIFKESWEYPFSDAESATEVDI